VAHYISLASIELRHRFKISYVWIVKHIHRATIVKQLGCVDGKLTDENLRLPLADWPIWILNPLRRFFHLLILASRQAPGRHRIFFAHVVVDLTDPAVKTIATALLASGDPELLARLDIEVVRLVARPLRLWELRPR
jgi:hypothetical protein